MKLMSFWSKFFIALAITILATTGAVVGVFAGQKEQIDMGGSIKYTVPYFTVTFLNYDDTVFETQQVAYGHDAVAPANNPTRPGYTFKSWTDYTNITSNRSVTANWIKNEAYLTTGSKWQAIVNASAVGSNANIEQIEFVSSVPSGATLIGSVGVTDETAATVWTENCGVFDVKAYYTALSTGKYKISFYSPYTIYAPKSSSFLFSNSTDYSNCLTSLTTLTFGNFNTSKVTSMSNMFFKCSKLTSLDLSKFETSSVTSMSNMFYECSSLTSLDVSNFNTSSVTNMWWMFNSCSSLISLNVSKFDTSKVTNMSYMFGYCSSLTSLNVSNFNTSKVTNMQSMFYNCSSLTSLNVSNFDTSNVTNMGVMFSDCSKLTSLNLSSFDMSRVTNTSDMLDWCVSLTEIQTPKAIGSAAIALPTKTNKSWFDQANTNNAYTQIDSSCLSKTLILKENNAYLLKGSLWQAALTSANSNFTQANIKTISFTKTAPTGSGYTQVPVGATSSAGTTAYASGTAGVSDITAYVKANSSDSTKYDVIFYSPVTIYAPVDSSFLFSNSTTANRLTNLTSINFGNFNTSKVTNM
ncbi:MAG: BspA family leucine-rich repeat surface protein, partial [Eubacteriales bacterium]|nr:BspA family leucine-rich repeat surface protein [Eubacteriales bacterium]